MADLTMGQRIGSERKKLGISQEGLGEKVGVSRQAISKWESDGAVPEIDKLIVLSKLFDVSVGWLLGVEEAPVPAAQADTLSDEQLYLIEEIVKKYQPKKLTYPWALLMCLILLLTTYIYRLQSNINTMDYAYDSLYTQFAELRARVQKLEDTQTNPDALSLFGDYSFEILQVAAEESGAPEAEIRFMAMPNVWKEGDSAYLTVTRAGMESFSMDCTWNGAWLFVTVPLEVADVYDFSMTIVHADGTQEQQVVTDPEVENLAETLSIPTEILSYSRSTENPLKLWNFEYRVTMPSAVYSYGDLSWEKVELLLVTSSGKELGRYSLLDAETSGTDTLYSPCVAGMHVEIAFEDVELPENEGILLWIRAELSNGLTSAEQVCTWVAEEDGTLRTQ